MVFTGSIEYSAHTSKKSQSQDAINRSLLHAHLLLYLDPFLPSLHASLGVLQAAGLPKRACSSVHVIVTSRGFARNHQLRKTLRLKVNCTLRDSRNTTTPTGLNTRAVIGGTTIYWVAIWTSLMQIRIGWPVFCKSLPRFASRDVVRLFGRLLDSGSSRCHVYALRRSLVAAPPCYQQCT